MYSRLVYMYRQTEVSRVTYHTRTYKYILCKLCVCVFCHAAVAVPYGCGWLYSYFIEFGLIIEATLPSNFAIYILLCLSPSVGDGVPSRKKSITDVKMPYYAINIHAIWGPFLAVLPNVLWGGGAPWGWTDSRPVNSQYKLLQKKPDG